LTTLISVLGEPAGQTGAVGRPDCEGLQGFGGAPGALRTFPNRTSTFAAERGETQGPDRTGLRPVGASRCSAGGFEAPPTGARWGEGCVLRVWRTERAAPTETPRIRNRLTLVGRTRSLLRRRTTSGVVAEPPPYRVRSEPVGSRNSALDLLRSLSLREVRVSTSSRNRRRGSTGSHI
jgi:hypothetical protein